jgi:hypothetical protein
LRRTTKNLIRFLFYFDVDPKLKDVTFEYLVNGKEIPKEELTLTAVDQAFGSNEYSVAGSLPENEKINEIQIIMKVQNKIQNAISIRGSALKQSPTESFMGRLWAFKRINYLLTDKNDCSKSLSGIFKFGNADSCRDEAQKLALEYSFVTDLTSLVIEENNSYMKRGPVQINKNPKYAKRTTQIPAKTSNPTQRRPTSRPTQRRPTSRPRQTRPSRFPSTQQSQKVDLSFSPGILRGPGTTAQSAGGDRTSLYPAAQSVSSYNLIKENLCLKFLLVTSQRKCNIHKYKPP